MTDLNTAQTADAVRTQLQDKIERAKHAYYEADRAAKVEPEGTPLNKFIARTTATHTLVTIDAFRQGLIEAWETLTGGRWEGARALFDQEIGPTG